MVVGTGDFVALSMGELQLDVVMVVDPTRANIVDARPQKFAKAKNLAGRPLESRKRAFRPTC
jgi:hypothetical protein